MQSNKREQISKKNFPRKKPDQAKKSLPQTVPPLSVCSCTTSCVRAPTNYYFLYRQLTHEKSQKKKLLFTHAANPGLPLSLRTESRDGKNQKPSSSHATCPWPRPKKILQEKQEQVTIKQSCHKGRLTWRRRHPKKIKKTLYDDLLSWLFLL